MLRLSVGLLGLAQSHKILKIDFSVLSPVGFITKLSTNFPTITIHALHKERESKRTPLHVRRKKKKKGSDKMVQGRRAAAKRVSDSVDGRQWRRRKQTEQKAKVK